MSIKKPALGRGLGALLGEVTARQVAATAAASAAGNPTPTVLGDELLKLPVDLLQRGKYQYEGESQSIRRSRNQAARRRSAKAYDWQTAGAARYSSSR